jgi:hypothetical protein
MRSFLMTAGALTMLCGAAWAQTSTSGSTSGANVNTTSGSQSNSVSNPRVNVYGNPIGNGASSSNSSAASRSNSNSRSGAAASSGQSTSTSGVIINNDYTSGTTNPASSISPASSTDAAGSTGASGNYPTNTTSTQTIRNTPEIVAPSIIGGNPCTVGASGGVALPGFGIVTGGSWEGKACERRQLAALLYNMGHDVAGTKGESLQEAAVEVLCNDQSVRAALNRIGQPCVADRNVVPMTTGPISFMAPKNGTSVAMAAPAMKTTPVATMAPATKTSPVAMAAPAPIPPASATPKSHPDWCYTASAQERRANKSCEGL